MFLKLKKGPGNMKLDLLLREFVGEVKFRLIRKIKTRQKLIKIRNAKFLRFFNF